MFKKNGIIHFVKITATAICLFVMPLAVSTPITSHDLTAIATSASIGSVSTVEQNQVGFIRRIVESLRYTVYKMGGKKFDTTHGVYIVDCSNFVDNILQHVSPRAYSRLVSATGAEAPASRQYYRFFKTLADNPDAHWNTVENIAQLHPGDILVFRYKNKRGLQTGGHVMIVMDKPVSEDNVFFVRVADSARGAHSEDTREPNESGVGIGTLLLKANAVTGKPAAYAWGMDDDWNKNVNFAMARPSDV